MNEEVRPGYYRDRNGNWQKDRRKGPRRKQKIIINHHDRRKTGRRKSDQAFEERESREAIADALEELEGGGGDDSD